LLSMVTIYPFVVVVRTETPYKSLPDLMAYAKANPGKLNYGSSGIGSTHHLAVELFNAMAGTDLVHVPFRTATVNEVVGGRVDVIFEVLSDAMPHVRGGRLRALAVTSATHWELLPELPPVARTLPGYDVTTWLGLAAAAGTPRAVVDRLNQEIRRVLALSDIGQRFQDLSIAPRPSSPEEMRQYIEKEIVKWKQVVESRKIERISIK
jgi:tripartite-type tricarboxylate transporter receptor subunit TctC